MAESPCPCTEPRSPASPRAKTTPGSHRLLAPVVAVGWQSRSTALRFPNTAHRPRRKTEPLLPARTGEVRQVDHERLDLVDATGDHLEDFEQEHAARHAHVRGQLM